MAQISLSLICLPGPLLVGVATPNPPTADEVANVAELLMGPAGAFITGSTILVDGGATASYYYGPLKPKQ